MYTELIKDTNELKKACDQSIERLEYIRTLEEYEVDFFNEVKPFVDRVMEIADRWMELANSWIQNERPKNLHQNQIDATHENIQMVSIQGFYKDTKYKRYKAMYESIQYVLKSINEKVQQ